MSSITDWISAIAAAIGIPFVLWGFIKLVIKDKDKQKQLDALEKIAQNQININSKLQEEVEQLTKQTGEFQYQSNLMFESNQIFEKQVSLLHEYFLESKASEKKKFEIEKQKRLLDIKPFFVSNGGGSYPQQFTIRLHNKGGTAEHLQIENLNPDAVIFNRIDPKSIVEKGKVLEITGSSISESNNRNSNLAEFEINIVFKDIDGSEYFQRIRRQNHQITFDNPLLRSSNL